MLHEVSKASKLNIHQMIIQTEAFDYFLHKKFNTFKRYAGEGTESMIIFLHNLCVNASINGVSDCVVGMPHRGRMNFLTNILNYPARDLFRKI